ITIPLTLSNLKLLRRITRTENILHRNFTRRQVAIQNRVASNIGISQSTFSVKVLNLFSRSRRKTNKRRSEERFSRNAETDLVCRLLLEKKKCPHCLGERSLSGADGKRLNDEPRTIATDDLAYVTVKVEM